MGYPAALAGSICDRAIELRLALHTLNSADPDFDDRKQAIIAELKQIATDADELNEAQKDVIQQLRQGGLSEWRRRRHRAAAAEQHALAAT